MITYIEAPSLYNSPTDYPVSLFLGGGITGCPDWQSEITKKLRNSVLELSNLNFVVFNPKREDFPMDDPTAAEGQIKWEHEYLRLSSSILFWFPSETLCPITLYELGSWSMTKKPLFVGCHPDYKRKQDVVIQTGLVRPDVKVVFSIDDLANQVISSLSNGATYV